MTNIVRNQKKTFVPTVLNFCTLFCFVLFLNGKTSSNRNCQTNVFSLSNHGKVGYADLPVSAQ